MRKTIGDRILDVYENYIAPSEKEQKVGKKEFKLDSTNAYGEKKEKWGTKELSTEKCIKVAKQCPILMKGIRKSTLDSIRAWYHLETWENRGDPIKADVKLIRDFERRTNFKYKWRKAIDIAKVTGDAYILIIFNATDDGVPITSAPHPKAIPYDIKVLNSKDITEIDYYSKDYEKRNVMHFHLENRNDNKDYWIHPDRIIHIPWDELPDSKFGNSIVNLLRNTIQSKINVDIASGEILSWFAHGTWDIEQEGMQESELEYWLKVAEAHPGAWVHDETANIEFLEPKAIDPTPFYDFLVLNISAACRVPKQVLTGNEPGRVTGAEVGFGDYYKDIKDTQDLLYSPLLERFWNLYLSRMGKSWKYNIVWNPVYIAEDSEAEILKNRCEAADIALNSRSKGGVGFITPDEAREVFNKGQVQLRGEAPKYVRKDDSDGSKSDDSVDRSSKGEDGED